MYINCNNLAKLPENIGNLKNLRKLHVKSACLKTLPESIGGLGMLETLVIDSPLLSELPSSIGDLRSLSKLILHKTQIKEIPETIGNLSKLEHFHLLNCSELQSLPDTIGKLCSIKTLYIWGSKIKSLPESIGNMISLLNLQLQYTDIASLPASIGNLVNLEVLGVFSYPKEESLGGKIDNIIEYDLGFNNSYKKIEKRSPFTVLPHETAKLAKLRFLILSNSEVTSLPDYLADLPSLEKIEAINCNLKNIPPSIQRLIDGGKLTLIRVEKKKPNDRE